MFRRWLWAAVLVGAFLLGGTVLMQAFAQASPSGNAATSSSSSSSSSSGRSWWRVTDWSLTRWLSSQLELQEGEEYPVYEPGSGPLEFVKTFFASYATGLKVLARSFFGRLVKGG